MQKQYIDLANSLLNNPSDLVGRSSARCPPGICGQTRCPSRLSAPAATATLHRNTPSARPTLTTIDNQLPTSSCRDEQVTMKYLPLSELDDVTDALNFETGDCRVVGACDVYLTKAAGGDKKLYKSIDSSLESRYEAALRLSASLSPPEAELIASSLNLSRSSPFGPLSQISSRRTFAYLIATLNASHPDYDFSQFLRPSDFRREKSLKKVMDTFDTNLFSLRPRHLQLSSSGGPGSGKWAPTASDLPEDAPPTPRRGNSSGGGGAGNVTWSAKMWQRVNAEMDLKECVMYVYEPDDEPFPDDDDDGLPLWSLHYFFFNKARKRVCYLYMRALSLAADGGRTPRTPITAGRTIDLSWARAEPSSAKRAKYWLGDRAMGNVIGGWDDYDDEDEEEEEEEEEEDDADDDTAHGDQETDDIGNESDVKIVPAIDASKYDDYDLSTSESPSPELGRKKRRDTDSARSQGPLTRSMSRGMDDDIAEAIEL